MSYTEDPDYMSSPRPSGRKFGQAWQLAAASLREHSVLIAIGLTHCLIAQVLPGWLGLPQTNAISVGDWVSFLAMRCLPAIGFGLCVYWLVLRRSHDRNEALRRYWAGIRGLTRFEVLVTAIPVAAMLIPVMSAFSFLKGIIPNIKPFSFDPWLMTLDRFLHLGHDPWQLLHPLLGHPLMTYVFSSVYVTWYSVLYGIVFWVAFWQRNRELRMQFLLTNVLLWPLLGNIAAIYFSSGGPVYYGQVTGGTNPFQPLFNYLQQADAVFSIQALEIQEMVWTRHLGVSAMPSMHVASAFCFFLLGRRIGRIAGWALGTYFVLILLGSVHLGWHYAVDGYAGIAGAFLLWRLSGWCLQREPVRRLLWPDAAPAAILVTR